MLITKIVAAAIIVWTSGIAVEAADRLSFRLEGQALDVRGQVVPGAKIDVRLETPKSVLKKTVHADAKGRFTAEFKVKATENTPITWSMQGSTPNSQQASVGGRYIALREDVLLVLDKPLMLAAESDFVAPNRLWAAPGESTDL